MAASGGVELGGSLEWTVATVDLGASRYATRLVFNAYRAA